MERAKDYVGKPVISVTEGRNVGTVKDVYLDSQLTGVVGIYLGSEGLLSRKELCIDRETVAVFGVDAVLVTGDDVVIDAGPACEANTWLRRDDLPGRMVATAGGTQVGTIDDVIVDDEMRVVGIQLGRIYVEGPATQNRSIIREAILDVGGETAMIIDLEVAERQRLKPVG
jgi:uncharacterized protein YrrD